MLDYSKLSDEALQQISSGKMDYSKLSDDDLQQIASADVKPQDNSPKVSQLESLARGFGKGVTSGFYNRLIGGADAISDKLSDVLTGNQGKDLSQYYDQRLQEAKNTENAAAEANPLTFKGGELTGTAAQFAVPGALGTQVGIKGLAGLGALSAVGNQSADLNSTETIKNAAIGGATGAALGGVGKLLGGALGRSFKLGQEGTNLASEAGQNELKAAANDAGKAVTQTLNEAPAPYNTPDILKKIINEAEDTAGNAGSKDIKDIISKYSSGGDMSNADFRALSDALGAYAKKEGGIQGQAAYNASSAIKNDVLEAIPGFKQAKIDFKQAIADKDLIPETKLPGIDFSDVATGGKSYVGKLFKNTKNFASNMAGLVDSYGKGLPSLATKSLGKTISDKVGNTVSSFYEIPQEHLVATAQELQKSDNKTVATLGQNLEQSIQDGDSQKQNATMFALEQLKGVNNIFGDKDQQVEE